MQMGIAPHGTDPLRYAAELLSVVVGDDNGSRLFWELVDPGYAESADLGYSEYDGDGAWMSYLSCARRTSAKTSNAAYPYSKKLTAVASHTKNSNRPETKSPQELYSEVNDPWDASLHSDPTGSIAANIAPSPKTCS